MAEASTWVELADDPDYPLPPVEVNAKAVPEEENAKATPEAQDEGEWSSARIKETKVVPQRKESRMMLVNMTALSSGAIHNRDDKHGVNDVQAKSALTRKIEADYEAYASNPDLLSRGVIRPCSSGVWRDALGTLRDDQPGQYWAPVWAKT